MKKRGFLFIVPILSLLLIVGCRGEKAEKEPVKLIWYGIGPRPKDTDRVFEEINKYLKEKINATVEYKTADWGEFTQKMQVLSASGEEFDLVFTASWTNFPQAVANGAFLPLDDLIKNQGKDLLKVINPQYFNASKVNGKIYAIPNMKEMAEETVFRINGEFIKKYNLRIPQKDIYTLKDFFPLLEVIKKNEKGIHPTSFLKDTRIPVETLNYILGIGFPGAVRIDSKDLKVINQFEDANQLEILRELRESYLKGYISRDAVSVNSTEAEKTSGRWFLDIAGYQPGAKILWERSYNHEVLIFPYYKNPVMTTASATGAMTAISSTSKHPEKAMELINLLNTDSYLRNLIDNGIEGIHYEKINSNTIKFLPTKAKDYGVPSWVFGNLFLTYLTVEDDQNKWSEFEKFNEKAKVSPIFGFTFDPSSVKNEVSALMNISEEYAPAIFTGTVDTDKGIKEMLVKMDNAGLQKVLGEMQKQIDEWKKKN